MYLLHIRPFGQEMTPEELHEATEEVLHEGEGSGKAAEAERQLEMFVQVNCKKMQEW